MTERFPDLEIYLMKASAAEVQQWLQQALGEPGAGSVCPALALWP